MPIGNHQIWATKCDSPFAALVRRFPMLCTRCAALAGCWMTHHMAKATPAHVRIVLRFTAASLEAQTSLLSQFLFILTRNPAWMGAPSRHGPGHDRPSAAVCPDPVGATHAP